MVQITNAWLKTGEIAKNVWRIENNGMVSEYLVKGKDRALLIDAGWGIGDLAALVNSMTTLPLTVMNTHGHPDHTDGNYQFDNVYIHEADVPMLEDNYSPIIRAHVLKRFEGMGLPDGFSREAWVQAKLGRYTPFSGTQSFDLGDRVLDVIETPGHTPGSICIFDRTEGLLFTGDNVSEGNTLLMMDHSLPLHTYLKSVEKLAAIGGQVRMLLPSHGKSPLSPSLLMEMRDGVEKVLAGELKGHPETTYLGSGLACRFGSCGILYKEDRL